jgi:hypothetical protein
LRNDYWVRISASAFAVALALTASTVARATPISWAADGFTFNDGSTLFGGITYDAATNSYSDIQLYAFGGALYDNVAYLYWDPSLPVLPNVIALVAGLPSGDLTGYPSLFINLESPLTGSPGSVVLSSVAIQALCADPACSGVDYANVAMANGGSLRAEVPEPSAAALSLVGLLAFAGWGMLRRRRCRISGE